MSERKGAIQFIPPDYDPAQKLHVKKRKRKTAGDQSREMIKDMTNMLPFDFRCSGCNKKTAAGTKFNTRMERADSYLGITNSRFYARCKFCQNRFTWKTDQKNHRYIVESGGEEVVNYTSQLNRDQAEEELARKLEEEQDPMKKTEREQTERRKKEMLNEYIEAERNKSKILSQMTDEEKFLAIQAARLREETTKEDNDVNEDVEDEDDENEEVLYAQFEERRRQRKVRRLDDSDDENSRTKEIEISSKQGRVENDNSGIEEKNANSILPSVKIEIKSKKLKKDKQNRKLNEKLDHDELVNTSTITQSTLNITDTSLNSFQKSTTEKPAPVVMKSLLGAYMSSSDEEDDDSENF